MSPQEFKSKYCHTLKSCPETQSAGGHVKQHYIKIPMSDLNELAYMQESLLDGIMLLTRLEKQDHKNEQLKSVIYWLGKLLKGSYPHSEMDGLAEWLADK